MSADTLIRVKTSPQLLAAFSTLCAHPVFKHVVSDYQIDRETIFIKPDRFPDKNILTHLVENDQAEIVNND